MSDAIQDALERAKEAAASATPSGVPATQGQAPAGSGNVVAFRPGAAPALTAADMMQGSFSVDAFLKVSEDGMKIGDSALITDPFVVNLDLTDVFYFWAVKYGNPAVYEKTTDKTFSLSGKPWQSVLDMAARVDAGKFKGDYRSADVPFVLLADVKDIKGKVVAEKGTRIGKSLSTTEWREFEGLLKSTMKAGFDANDSVVEVEVGFKPRSNANNKWGVLTFTLKGLAVPDDVADAA